MRKLRKHHRLLLFTALLILILICILFAAHSNKAAEKENKQHKAVTGNHEYPANEADYAMFLNLRASCSTMTVGRNEELLCRLLENKNAESAWNRITWSLENAPIPLTEEELVFLQFSIPASLSQSIQKKLLTLYITSYENEVTETTSCMIFNLLISFESDENLHVSERDATLTAIYDELCQFLDQLSIDDIFSSGNALLTEEAERLADHYSSEMLQIKCTITNL